MVGKMVLNRNPDNFFAETEQVAFCPSHLVPGLDFSEDPLLQGRLFSYLDTQMSRLGGPNFHQLPVNAPKCPFHNLQRDGIHQMSVPAGRVAYEPNSLDVNAPRESMEQGFATSARTVEGVDLRARSESFSDHYSQARMFYRSITPPEQKHLADALTFELSKLETEAVRLRMLGHLLLIDTKLAEKVITALGAAGKAEKVAPAKTPVDLDPSPALRLYGKFKPTLEGRKIGVLIGAGFDATVRKDVVSQIERAGAKAAIIASKIHGELDSRGRLEVPDLALRTSPSVLFDAVVVLSGPDGDKKLSSDPNAIAFLMDANRHCKAVGFAGAPALAKQSGILEAPGIVNIATKAGINRFIDAARAGRFWEREVD
jgi:catalase